MRSPSDGLLERPVPMASGTMMKWRRASSGWPGPNSSPPNCRARLQRAVQRQHRQARRIAQRGVVQAQRGQGLAVLEAEVRHGPFVLARLVDVVCPGKP
jgi:hypothetical protein